MVQKCPLFVNVHTIENVNAGGIEGPKRHNLVNVVCERPLRMIVDTLTEYFLDWIPQNTRKLKITSLEFSRVKQLNSNFFVFLLLATLSIFFPPTNSGAPILSFLGFRYPVQKFLYYSVNALNHKVHFWIQAFNDFFSLFTEILDLKGRPHFF